MTEPKFTPGPWVFGTKGDWTISSAAHSGSLMGNASYYPWVPENKADWHLIAAAPELYEALESLVRNGQKQGWNDKYEWDMDKAKAALAKARGESHD